jgi:Na+/H+ antiporter NhaC
MDYSALSLIPALLAIILAILTRDVVMSLLIGIFSGYLIMNGFHPADAFVSLFEGIISLFSEGWITKTIIFALLVGSIIRLIVDSGGVDGFVEYLTKKSQIIKSKRASLLLAYIIGLVIFIESSITSLLAGTVSRPLTDKYGASRQKLAYVCDATSAPVCSLIALNGWGALLIGLITSQISAGMISGNAVEIFIHAIPFNFYAIVALILVLIVILSGKDFGSMKRYEQEAQPIETHSSMAEGKISRMLLPLLVLIVTMPVALYLTGKGNILEGSGSSSVFYAVIVTLLFTFVFFMLTKTMSRKAFFTSFYKGISDMIPIALILILAFAIGKLTNDLGTGKYLASLAEGLVSPALIPVIVFLLASIIAFSTGTSWGTFSIMMPIAITLAVSTDANLYLVIGAVISGGIFGDHSSPISDTTIISSMAAGCDHIEHVTTQLPYALLGGVISAILFILSGFFLKCC